MTNKLQVAMVCLAIALLLAIGLWIAVYRFEDCIKVGHSRLYCWMGVMR